MVFAVGGCEEFKSDENAYKTSIALSKDESTNNSLIYQIYEDTAIYIYPLQDFCIDAHILYYDKVVCRQLPWQ